MTKHTYSLFTIPGAYTDMKHLCKEKLQSLYGTKPPMSFVERLDDEFSLIERGNLSSIYMLLHHLAVHLQKHGGRIGIRGALGSTLVSFLLGITDINPLPAHSHCPKCGYVSLSSKDSGFELAESDCPNCGALLRGDGHNIPYETLQDSQTDTVDINVSASAWENAVSFLVDFLGTERIACAPEWNNPVCYMLLPEEMQFEDVTPVTELNTPVCGVNKQTVLPGYELTPKLLRMILLPHNDSDRIHQLHRLTKTTPEDIDYSDPNIYKLFQNLDTCGIPGFSSDRSKDILQNCKDMQFSDLIRVSGMSCGSGVWEENGKTLLPNHNFRELIATRDDIFLTLRKQGIGSKTAKVVMEIVRKGKFHENTPENLKKAQEMLRAGVPVWYVDSMKKIHYLFPKAHAAQCAKTAATLAWFKLYHPKAFYRISLSYMGIKDLALYDNGALMTALKKGDSSEESNREAIELLLEAHRRNIFKECEDVSESADANIR